MRHIIRRVLPLALAAILAPAAAQAQAEQTIAGAQNFLTILAGRNDLTLNKECMPGEGPLACRTVVDVGQYCVRQGNGFCAQSRSGTTRALPEMRILSAQVAAPCEMRFGHMDHRKEGDDPNVVGDARIVEFGPVATLYRWGRVSSVQVVGREVYFRHPHPNNPGFQSGNRITASSPDLAARVGYALDFLRINCDATSGTGF